MNPTNHSLRAISPSRATMLAVSALLVMLIACPMLTHAKGKAKKLDNQDYVTVTDFISNDGQTDVADALQDIIDRHPNRTIFFPDGTYLSLIHI